MSPQSTLLLAFPEHTGEGERLAAALGCPFAAVRIHHFPDGESLIRLPPELPERVVLYRTLHHPNAKLTELLLAARGAREVGARELLLVIPYLCYMRQDKAFHPGEVVSQRIVGRFLGELCDGLFTVDTHLHRIDHLEEAIPSGGVNLSAAPLLGRLVAERRPGALLLGPDAESAQWVASAAGAGGLDHAVARKVRSGDRSVSIHLPEREFRDRRVVLLDDVASSGMTLARAAEAVLAAGARSVDAAVTHALFAPGAEEAIRSAGIDEVWSTDTIPHPTNSVQMAAPLAEAIRAWR
ncbi:MAG TPA: ribose-phosphate diphosphokinase [Thiotrichales bacterium]|nr:ribose-phosphate diphosphokinase [Thiotrichales bacterium]